MLSGTPGRRCFRLSKKSFLIFLIVAPENDGTDERHNERHPSKWSSDSTYAFSKRVSAQSEHCRPDNSPGGVVDEKPQRGQSIRASQQCRKGQQQGNETSAKDD